MEQRNDDLSSEEGLPRPGTEEPADGSSSEEGDAGSGPGNVSVDEPTAGSLGRDAGAPGGDGDEESDDDD